MFTNTTFKLSERQMQRIKEWDDVDTGHKCTAKVETFRSGEKYKYSGAIGGSLSVTFTPTSIGVFVKVKCQSCNKELDVSEV